MEDNNDRPQSQQSASPGQQESSELNDRAVTNSAFPAAQINQNNQGDYNQTIGQMFGGIAIGSMTGNVTIQSERQPFLSEHQLPPDIADFTGRTEELEKVLAELRKDSQRNTVAISGMAGTGKSALAIRAAHQLQAEFDQVQLYVNLRGADDHQAVEPANVLVEWLRALGLDDASIPAELEERTKAYRHLLQGKRAIVLLDNAQDEEQVRPLLPASSTCAVLITSRKKLVALQGTTWLELPILPEDEALTLFKTLIGTARVEAEADPAEAILSLCGRLPLAIRIAAGTLNKSSQQRKSLAEYAHKLRDERQRLSELHLDHLEENLDVRTSFNLSYRALSDELCRLFRWLGLLEASDFGAGVAAVLTETDEATAQQQLEQLIDAQLLEELGQQRYRFHDLIRLFAREQLEQTELPEQQSNARQRVIQHFLHWSNFMDGRLRPSRRREIADSQIADNPTLSREQTERDLELRALAWFEQERPTLLTLAAWISEAQTWEQLSHLSGNLALFLDRRSYWLDAERLQVQSLNAARHLGDVYGEGASLNNLGAVYDSQGKWSEAIQCYEQSLQTFRAIGDVHGEGQSLNNLGAVYQSQGKWSEAIECYEQSLQIKRSIGDVHGEGQSLNNLGIVYHAQGRWDEAKPLWQEALTKLHPDSPEAQQLAEWLQSLDRPPDRPHQPTLFHRLAPWLLLLAVALFLIPNLLAGQWLVALAIVLVAGIAWFCLKAMRNRN